MRPIYIPQQVLSIVILSLLLSVGEASVPKKVTPSPVVDLGRPYFDPYIPCSPVSEFTFNDDGDQQPSLQFCSKWNPDFPYNGMRCCSVRSSRRYKHATTSCAPRKGNRNYCDDRTPAQLRYFEQVESGRLGDLLAYLTLEMGKSGQQSYCSVNNGFLVQGRPVVPTPLNRIELNYPGRCLNYGTDPMVAMIEWLGRQISARHSEVKDDGVRLVVGNISGPRGGCLIGRSGRRGHLSHTAGVDADIGFVNKGATGGQGRAFSRRFEPQSNWWFIKQAFSNPFACIKVIFLDRQHIRSLARVAAKDPKWAKLGRYIRHAAGHRNHLHIRVGNGPGLPGCVPGARPELEEVDEIIADGMDGDV